MGGHMLLEQCDGLILVVVRRHVTAVWKRALQGDHPRESLGVVVRLGHVVVVEGPQVLPLQLVVGLIVPVRLSSQANCSDFTRSRE